MVTHIALIFPRCVYRRFFLFQNLCESYSRWNVCFPIFFTPVDSECMCDWQKCSFLKNSCGTSFALLGTFGIICNYSVTEPDSSSFFFINALITILQLLSSSLECLLFNYRPNLSLSSANVKMRKFLQTRTWIPSLLCKK